MCFFFEFLRLQLCMHTSKTHGFYFHSISYARFSKHDQIAADAQVHGSNSFGLNYLLSCFGVILRTVPKCVQNIGRECVNENRPVPLLILSYCGHHIENFIFIKI